MRESMRRRLGLGADYHGVRWQWMRLSHPLSVGAQSAVKLLLVAGGVGSFLVGYGIHNHLLFPPASTQAPVAQIVHSTHASATSGLGNNVTTVNPQRHTTHAPYTMAIRAPASTTRNTSPGKGHGKATVKGHDKGQGKGQHGDKGKAESGGHGHHGNDGNGHGNGHSKGHGGNPHGGPLHPTQSNGKHTHGHGAGHKNDMHG